MKIISKPHRHLEKIIELNNSGWSTSMIGKHLGCSKQNIWQIAHNDPRYLNPKKKMLLAKKKYVNKNMEDTKS